MNSLFSRDLTVAVLASGSAGNCTYVGDGHGGVLIDCGVSTRQILGRLAALGLEDAPIDAVLVTHEHSDHVGAARILCDRLHKRTGRHVPFYMTGGTAENIKEVCVPASVERVGCTEEVRVKHFLCEPLPIPHDTLDPVAWRVNMGGTWVGVFTDMGRPTHLVAQKLRECTVAVLEFNHDTEMLLDGPYPWHLKQRIRSSHGHLSNEQAARLLFDGIGPELRHVVLAHLSEKNNAPAKALAAAGAALRSAGVHDEITLHLGRQREPLQPVRVPVRQW